MVAYMFPLQEFLYFVKMGQYPIIIIVGHSELWTWIKQGHNLVKKESWMYFTLVDNDIIHLFTDLLTRLIPVNITYYIFFYM